MARERVKGARAPISLPTLSEGVLSCSQLDHTYIAMRHRPKSRSEVSCQARRGACSTFIRFSVAANYYSFVASVQARSLCPPEKHPTSLTSTIPPLRYSNIANPIPTFIDKEYSHHLLLPLPGLPEYDDAMPATKLINVSTTWLCAFISILASCLDTARACRLRHRLRCHGQPERTRETWNREVVTTRHYDTSGQLCRTVYETLDTEQMGHA